jgi:hypothetical protein
LDEEENEKTNLKAIINHASYVYCSKFLPIDIGSNNFFIITGCFDA